MKWNKNSCFNQELTPTLILNDLCVVPLSCAFALSKAFLLALMDTCAFKSIPINEPESSNGASFQEGEPEYTFSLRGPDCNVHSAHSALYWNERCAAWLPKRVKSFPEIGDGEDGYMHSFFLFFPSSLLPLIHPFNREGMKGDADGLRTW